MKKYFCYSKGLYELINKKYNVNNLEIENISKYHKKGNNTHYIINLVTDDFKKLNIIQRNKEIVKYLKENDIFNKIYSISFNLKTNEEFLKNKEKNDIINCLGKNN